MTSPTMKAKTVRIHIEKGSAGLFYADSPDLKGLLTAAPTLEELAGAIKEAIIALYAACDVPVLVSRAEGDEGDGFEPWVAFPVEVARQALEAI
jgi:predicted RNase H-like HicB family nuclease